MTRCGLSAWRRSSRSVRLDMGSNRWVESEDELTPLPGILDLGRLVQSDAFRTVLLAFKDGPTELGPAMTGMLLYLTNQPSTRHLLIPGSDLEVSFISTTSMSQPWNGS